MTVDQILKHISPGAGIVWLVLFRNAYEGKARISVERIASFCSFGERQVVRHVNELVERGIVRRAVRGSKNGGPTVYELNPDYIAALEPNEPEHAMSDMTH